MNITGQSITENGACLIDGASVSRVAERLVPTFSAYGLGFDPETVRVSDVYIPTGPVPGYAIIEIRRTPSGRYPNVVAFGDVWKNVLIGTEVYIERVATGVSARNFFSGVVVDVNADVKKDSLSVIAYDLRHMLRDIRIVGRHVADPVSKTISWQQGWPAEFNPDGRPNMILIGDTPVFAPSPDYGLAPDEAPPDPLMSGGTQACYWTVGYIFRYLHYALGPDALGLYDGFQLHVPKVCPSNIQWLVSMADVLDAEANSWFDQGRSQSRAQASGSGRKGRSISADGYALLDFMELLLSTAGGYTIGWYMSGSATASSKSTLQIVRSVAAGKGDADTINLCRGADVENLRPASKYFNGGNYTESGKDLVTSAMGLGSLVKIERQFDTYLNVSIVPRWSNAEQSALMARGKALSVADADGARSLFSEFPGVWNAWKIEDDYDFQAGTSESNFPRASIARPIMPALLSWLGTVAYDYMAQKYPIRVEVSVDGEDWTVVTEMTGLEILDDGTFFLPTLRELPLSGSPGAWRWNDEEYSWESGDIVTNEIRATLAIPCDHRLASVVRLIDMDLAADSEITSVDQSRIAPYFDRRDVIDARGLYDLWLRKDSYPVPQSQLDEKAVDKPSRANALRNDFELLHNHVRRHMLYAGRLQRDGYFSKDGCFDTSLLQLGHEYSRITTHKASGATQTVPVCLVRRAIQFISGAAFSGTRMHVS